MMEVKAVLDSPVECLLPFVFISEIGVDQGAVHHWHFLVLHGRGAPPLADYHPQLDAGCCMASLVTGAEMWSS
jgi:hypothetical protein